MGIRINLLIKAILHKGKITGEDIIKKYYFYIFGAAISDRRFFRQFRNSKVGFRSAGEIKEYLTQREKPGFFIDSKSQESIIAVIQKHHPYLQEDIVRDADKICEHYFDLLGSGPKKIQSSSVTDSMADKIQNYLPIDWHIDFKTGYRWNPKKYYKDIKIPYGKADIKVPWELSRFQHLSSLGQAYWLTRDEKYAEEFVNQINDWIESNSPRLGVNWTCTMDVAIRLVDWVCGYYFFKDSKAITDNFLKRLLKSLMIHGQHIMGNLENKWRVISNHYLSDIVGLVYLGMTFPEFKEAKRWRKFGIREIVKIMEKQVYPDGCDFEASTCYHRLVLELFFFSTLLVVTNDNEFNGKNYKEITEKIFGRSYTERLYKMFEVVLYTLKPNGRMPQIGDNDSGRLHIFANRELLDMRYLLTLGAIFFKECKFKIKEFGFCEEALWVFGEEGYKIWQNLEANCSANIGSRAFSDAGWYIMRRNKNYMIISCGSNGQNGNGGHSHNDKLSFQLCINDEEFIVDPGTYLYTSEPKMRNLFRSTAYHNTVVIDDKEQNRFNERSLFEMRDDSKARCLKWESDGEYDLLIGEHNGYRRLTESTVHRRVIKFSKKKTEWEIKDEFYRANSKMRRSNSKTPYPNHRYDWYFHLAPQIVVEQIERNEFLFRGEGNTLNFRIYDLASECSLVTEESWFSPRYGVKVKSNLLKLECKHKLPFQMGFKIWTE